MSDKDIFQVKFTIEVYADNKQDAANAVNKMLKDGGTEWAWEVKDLSYSDDEFEFIDTE